MKTRNNHTSLRRDKRAVSPAISTVVLTAAGIVMILIAMSYCKQHLGHKDGSKRIQHKQTIYADNCSAD